MEIWKKLNFFLSNHKLKNEEIDFDFFTKLHFQAFFLKDAINFKKDPLNGGIIQEKLNVLTYLSKLMNKQLHNYSYFIYFKDKKLN